jgi:outer membrane putative beta-barrel porin/alpha-amylase
VLARKSDTALLADRAAVVFRPPFPRSESAARSLILRLVSQYVFAPAAGREKELWKVLTLSWLTGMVLLLSPGPHSAAAQELEPRAYSASPVGVNFFVVGFNRSTGAVTFDPTIPITDVQAHLNIPTLGLGHTFGIWGRQALVTAGLPYAWGELEGKVAEQQQRITRSGLADLRLKFSVNLHGNPARTPREFAQVPRRGVLVGTSLTVQAPTGQYDPTKLVNLGTNRWAFKPELGISYLWKKFELDLYGGAWLFGDNSRFYPGESLRKQDPITTLQGHVSYTIRRQMWFAVDGTWYRGGAVYVNGGLPTISQNNTRFGATLSLPLSKRQSLKVAYGAGATARTGSNFDTIGVTWQFMWFGLRP